MRLLQEGFTEESLGHTATIFGATGFLGRYIANRLGTETSDPKQMSSITMNSPFGMYGGSAFPGGDGKATPEVNGRLGEGCFHGKLSAMLRLVKYCWLTALVL